MVDTTTTMSSASASSPHSLSAPASCTDWQCAATERDQLRLAMSIIAMQLEKQTAVDSPVAVTAEQTKINASEEKLESHKTQDSVKPATADITVTQAPCAPSNANLVRLVEIMLDHIPGVDCPSVRHDWTKTLPAVAKWLQACEAIANRIVTTPTGEEPTIAMYPLFITTRVKYEEKGDCIGCHKHVKKSFAAVKAIALKEGIF